MGYLPFELGLGNVGSIKEIRERFFKVAQGWAEKGFALNDSAMSEVGQCYNELLNKLSLTTATSTGVRYFLSEYPEVRKRLKKTPTGAESFAYESVENAILSSGDEDPKLINLLEAMKLSSVMTKINELKMNSAGGRVYPICKENSTFRVAYAEPCVSNLPKSVTLLKADEGHSLYSIDFSAHEMYILANLTKNKEWIDAYERGDLYEHIVNGVFTEEEFTKYRDDIKTNIIATVYGSRRVQLSVTPYSDKKRMEKVCDNVRSNAYYKEYYTKVSGSSGFSIKNSDCEYDETWEKDTTTTTQSLNNIPQVLSALITAFKCTQANTIFNGRDVRFMYTNYDALYLSARDESLIAEIADFMCKSCITGWSNMRVRSKKM